MPPPLAAGRDVCVGRPLCDGRPRCLAALPLGRRLPSLHLCTHPLHVGWVPLTSTALPHCCCLSQPGLQLVLLSLKENLLLWLHLASSAQAPSHYRCPCCPAPLLPACRRPAPGALIRGAVRRAAAVRGVQGLYQLALPLAAPRQVPLSLAAGWHRCAAVELRADASTRFSFPTASFCLPYTTPATSVSLRYGPYGPRSVAPLTLHHSTFCAFLRPRPRCARVAQQALAPCPEAGLETNSECVQVFVKRSHAASCCRGGGVPRLRMAGAQVMLIAAVRPGAAGYSAIGSSISRKVQPAAPQPRRAGPGGTRVGTCPRFAQVLPAGQRALVIRGGAAAVDTVTKMQRTLGGDSGSAVGADASAPVVQLLPAASAQLQQLQLVDQKLPGALVVAPEDLQLPPGQLSYIERGRPLVESDRPTGRQVSTVAFENCST